ncbi:MAG TPA: hypothetical protein GX532_03515, partial [Clostridia bacterium]|nr:hypothetical protein [Clostridia bacterium]
INSIFVILIFIKYSELKFLKEEYLFLKNDLDELLYENSYLSTQYLDNLEEKIARGEQLLQDLAEKKSRLEKSGIAFADEDNEEKYNPVTLEIARLLKQGKSITEIAEQLNTTKGEVVLRLNLGKKIAKQK